MKTIEEFRKELDYIITTSVNGANNFKTLVNFNKDFDCFNRYIEMQANSADKAGFPGIAREMLDCRL